MNISVSEYRNSTLLAEYPILLTFSVLDCNADTSIVIPVDTNATSIDDMYSDTYIALYQPQMRLAYNMAALSSMLICMI
jgi:hypothetical protein